MPTINAAYIHHMFKKKHYNHISNTMGFFFASGGFH